MILVLIGRPLLPGLFEQLPPNVLLSEGWPHDAFKAAWWLCSVAIVPSVAADSCPTVAIEAMSMGKPVIASSIGRLSDMVIDGQTDCPVSPGGAHKLRDANQVLLVDPVRQERMDCAAKQHAAAFQAASIVAQIEHPYQEVLTSCAV